MKFQVEAPSPSAPGSVHGFWARRDDVGVRVASVLFRKADAVSAAAHASGKLELIIVKDLEK